MIANVIALALLTALALIGAYGAMRSHWPSSYVDVTTTTGQIGRFSFKWFVIFRTAPAFLTASVIGATADRLNTSAWVVVGLGLLLFAGFGLWHGIAEARRRRNGANVLLVSGVGTILTLASGALGIWTRSWTAPFVPEPQALLEAIWTAAIVAIAYFAVTRILNDTRRDEFSTQKRAKADIGKRVWEYSREAADEHQIDVRAVRAILFAEAIQRPRWFRTLERMLQHVGRIFGRQGTTGVAQMRSKDVLSDEESITLLCRDMASRGLAVADMSEDQMTVRIAEYARHHNNDEVFVDSVVEQLMYLLDADE